MPSIGWAMKKIFNSRSPKNDLFVVPKKFRFASRNMRVLQKKRIVLKNCVKNVLN